MSSSHAFSGLLLLALLCNAPAQAATANHAAYAERLLELTHADRLAVPVYAQVQQMFAKGFSESKAPANRQALLESYQAKANATLDKAIGWNQLKPSLIKLYSDEFTEAELKQMVDFYQSELGRKMLTKLPALNQRSAQMAQSRIEGIAPEVNKLLDEMMTELGAKKK